jgi:hypothetical protein
MNQHPEDKHSYNEATKKLKDKTKESKKKHFRYTFEA